MAAINQNIQDIAGAIRAAYVTAPISPIRTQLIFQEVDTAYEIQEANTSYWLSHGRRIVGCKIGLTSPAVQKQLRVNQPDFGILVIDYVPGRWLLESKSLKLYLASFRNHGAYHEACTLDIGKTIAGLIAPRFLRIGGYWYPRGGIPIDVFWQTGKAPAGLWLPDQGIPPYRARG